MVKNLRTPCVGGASAIGLVASMTGFRERFLLPAARSASAAARAFDRQNDHLPKACGIAEAADERLWILAVPSRELCLVARTDHGVVPVLEKAGRERLPNDAGTENSYLHAKFLLL